MAFIEWLSSHITSLIQTLGVIGGLIFTAYSFRLDARARRVSNLLAITAHHRNIWSELYDRPELMRVLQADVDLAQVPIKPSEELFIRLLILHFESTFKASRQGEYRQPEGLSQDVAQFFSLPLPSVVWTRIRAFQDRDFVQFVENTLREYQH